MCTCNPESQMYPRLHQEKCDQQVVGGDSAPILCLHETSPYPNILLFYDSIIHNCSCFLSPIVIYPVEKKKMATRFCKFFVLLSCPEKKINSKHQIFSLQHSPRSYFLISIIQCYIICASSENKLFNSGSHQTIVKL